MTESAQALTLAASGLPSLPALAWPSGPPRAPAGRGRPRRSSTSDRCPRPCWFTHDGPGWRWLNPGDQELATIEQDCAALDW